MQITIFEDVCARARRIEEETLRANRQARQYQPPKDPRNLPYQVLRVIWDRK